MILIYRTLVDLFEDPFKEPLKEPYLLSPMILQVVAPGVRGALVCADHLGRVLSQAGEVEEAEAGTWRVPLKGIRQGGSFKECLGV